MKIFRATAEEIRTIETLVLGNNSQEAKQLASRAINSGELEFDEPTIYSWNEKAPYSLTVKELDLTKTDAVNAILKEIKGWGIVNREAELEYDPSVIEILFKAQEKQQKEEYLKKHHMEFDFNKEKYET